MLKITIFTLNQPWVLKTGELEAFTFPARSNEAKEILIL